MATDSHIGRQASLISKSDIRYEGTISNLDFVDRLIELKSVRIYGTEDRRNDESTVKGSDRVYEKVTFRSEDVKEMTLLDQPSLPPVAQAAGPDTVAPLFSPNPPSSEPGFSASLAPPSLQPQSAPPASLPDHLFPHQSPPGSDLWGAPLNPVWHGNYLGHQLPAQQVPGPPSADDVSQSPVALLPSPFTSAPITIEEPAIAKHAESQKAESVPEGSRKETLEVEGSLPHPATSADGSAPAAAPEASSAVPPNSRGTVKPAGAPKGAPPLLPLPGPLPGPLPEMGRGQEKGPHGGNTWQQGGHHGGRRGQRSRGGGAVQPSRGVVQQSEQEEFDFASMNDKFKKEEVWGELGAKEARAQVGSGEGAAGVEQKGNGEKNAPGKYSKDDFFDVISCDVNRGEGGRRHSGRSMSEQRKVDSETFGATSVRGGSRGGYRGRGRGGFRGGGGGYYQNPNPNSAHPDQGQNYPLEGQRRGRGGYRGGFRQATRGQGYEGGGGRGRSNNPNGNPRFVADSQVAA